MDGHRADTGLTASPMLAHAIVLGMEKIDRTRIDARFAAFLDKLLRDRELSNAGVERLTGGRIGYNRVRDLRRGKGDPSGSEST